MRIWALADLHLTLSHPEKDMAAFGPVWNDYQRRMAEAWDRLVAPEDIICIPGDISWAQKLEDALIDLAWIAARPGIKVMIKGNHDHWWTGIAKVRRILPPNSYAIQHDSVVINNVAFCGTRLWDSPSFDFNGYVNMRPSLVEPKAAAKIPSPEETTHIYERELGRLEASLKSLPKDANLRIALTHYPPLSATLEPSAASALFEQHGIRHVLFGHLHSLYPNLQLFGTRNGITYHLVAADAIDFTPQLIAEIPS